MQFSSFFISKIFALKLSIVLQKSINDSLSIDLQKKEKRKKETSVAEVRSGFSKVGWKKSGSFLTGFRGETRSP